MLFWIIGGSIVLILIIFFVLYFRRKTPVVDNWNSVVETQKVVQEAAQEPPSLLTVQKTLPPDILLNVWVFMKNKMIIFYKFEKINGEYIMSNSVFPGTTKIELDGNKIMQNDKTITKQVLLGILEGDKIIIQNPEKDEIVIAVEADYNVPVFYYGGWEEGNNTYGVLPNERKKNVVQIRSGPNVADADVNGFNITFLGKTGKVEDMKIKWSDGTVWQKLL